MIRSLLFAFIALVSTGPLIPHDVRGTILPPDPAKTWNPGLMSVDGISNRTTIFTNISASTYGNGAQDASAGIQAAIEACPAGQVVLLSAGTFWQPTPAGFPKNAEVWAGDRVAWNMHLRQQQYQDDCDNSDTTGPFDADSGGQVIRPPVAMSWFCRPDRPTCEIKEIASVNGNIITFTTPLHISYRTNHTAQLTPTATIQDHCRTGQAPR
jgi:hypothetical protein